MDKAHLAAVGALLGFVGEQPVALGRESIHGRPDIVDPDADVVEAGSSAFQVPSDGRIRAGGLEQLQPGLPERQEAHPNALRRHLLLALELESMNLEALGDASAGAAWRHVFDEARDDDTRDRSTAALERLGEKPPA